jgi:hypothetical protein
VIEPLEKVTFPEHLCFENPAISGSKMQVSPWELMFSITGADQLSPYKPVLHLQAFVSTHASFFKNFMDAALQKKGSPSGHISIDSIWSLENAHESRVYPWAKNEGESVYSVYTSKETERFISVSYDSLHAVLSGVLAKVATATSLGRSW